MATSIGLATRQVGARLVHENRAELPYTLTRRYSSAKPLPIFVVTGQKPVAEFQLPSGTSILDLAFDTGTRQIYLATYEKGRSVIRAIRGSTVSALWKLPPGHLVCGQVYKRADTIRTISEDLRTGEQTPLGRQDEQYTEFILGRTPRGTGLKTTTIGIGYDSFIDYDKAVGGPARTHREETLRRAEIGWLAELPLARQALCIRHLRAHPLQFSPSGRTIASALGIGLDAVINASRADQRRHHVVFDAHGPLQPLGQLGVRLQAVAADDTRVAVEGAAFEGEDRQPRVVWLNVAGPSVKVEGVRKGVLARTLEMWPPAEVQKTFEHRRPRVWDSQGPTGYVDLVEEATE